VKLYYVGEHEELKRIFTQGFPLDREKVQPVYTDEARAYRLADESRSKHYLILTLPGKTPPHLKQPGAYSLPTETANRCKRKLPPKIAGMSFVGETE